MKRPATYIEAVNDLANSFQDLKLTIIREFNKKFNITCCKEEYGCTICNPPPTKRELTCWNCDERFNCKFVDDHYNTNGDCLASK